MHSRAPFKRLATGLALTLPLLFGGCHVTHHHDYYEPNTLVIQNDTHSIGDIWYAYVAPSAASSWGPDLLGNEVLQPGDELVVDVFECNRHYDIRVEYDNGGPIIEQYDVWLPCDTTTYVSFIDW
jgi:predicted RNA-binding protein associated with RNAse of E/G family